MKKTIFLCCVLLIPVRIVFAQWQQTATNVGDALCLAISGNNIFAGTSGYGVYLSSNNGTTWTQLNSGLTELWVNDLLISGTDIFAATDDGVFLSANNGSTWSFKGLHYLPVSSLVKKGSNIFAGTYSDGVYLSTDNGATWTKKSSGLTASVPALAANSSYVYAGLTSNDGLYRSSDNGTTWSWVLDGGLTSSIHQITTSGSNIFAVAYAGLFYSTDNGANWGHDYWTNLCNETSSILINNSHIYIGGLSGCLSVSALSPLSWSYASSNLPSDNIQALASNGTYLFASTYGDGVWRRPLSEITGIDNNYNNGMEVSIRPGPSKDFITIEDHAPGKEKTIIITDIQGCMIWQQKGQQVETDIDISFLPAGVYIVKVYYENINTVKKIIKD